MADNIELSAGSGGAIVKTDDDGTAHWQYIKQAFGADGTRTRVTSAVGLPVNLIDIEGNAVALSSGAVDAGTLRVTLASDDPAVTDLAAIEVLLGTIDADTGAIKTALEGTLTVGSHAVTNAGTFAVQVNGAALTALQLIDNLVLAEDAAHQNGDAGVQMLAVRSDTPTTKVGANGDYHPLLVDADGRLFTTIVDGGNSITVDGTITANAGTNLNTSALALESGGNLDTIAAALGGTLTVGSHEITNITGTISLPTGAATEAAQGTANTALSNIQTAVQLIDNAISGNEMQVDVVAALPAGTNLIGDVGLQPRTSGGLTIFRSLDLDESEEEVKATAGQVYWVHAINIGTGVRYLKFYNATAANVTVGTTTPVLTIPIPTQGDANGAGFTVNIPQGLAFDTAITVAATTGVADNDTGAPGANEVIVNMGYK